MKSLFSLLFVLISFGAMPLAHAESMKRVLQAKDMNHEEFKRLLAVEFALSCYCNSGRVLATYAQRRRAIVTERLDEMALLGVNKTGIAPWSPLVGGNGRQFQYEREVNVYGFAVSNFQKAA